MPVPVLVSELHNSPVKWLIKCLSVADCGGDMGKSAVDLSHAIGDKWCLVFVVSKGSVTDEMPKIDYVSLRSYRQRQ